MRMVYAVIQRGSSDLTPKAIYANREMAESFCKAANAQVDENDGYWFAIKEYVLIGE